MQIHLNKNEILTTIGFLSILAFLLFSQSSFKPIPQLFLVSLGFFSSLLLFKKKGNFLFLCMLGLSLFLIGFFATNLLIELIYTNRGWAVDNNGKRLGRVMDMSIFLGVFPGIFLSIFALWFYTKKTQRQIKSEILSSLLFTFISILILLLTKIL